MVWSRLSQILTDLIGFDSLSPFLLFCSWLAPKSTLWYPQVHVRDPEILFGHCKFPHVRQCQMFHRIRYWKVTDICKYQTYGGARHPIDRTVHRCEIPVLRQYQTFTSTSCLSDQSGSSFVLVPDIHKYQMSVRSIRIVICISTRHSQVPDVSFYRTESSFECTRHSQVPDVCLNKQNHRLKVPEIH